MNKNISKLVSFTKYREEFLNRELSPVELIKKTFDSINKLNPSIKAFTTTNEFNAIKQAKLAEKRYFNGNTLSNLDGCPFAVKDIISTSELPTQMNSKIFSRWKSNVDAACIYALKKAGCILVGKTETTPFALGHTSKTRNPHNINHTPGGSSSGSGAAVGAGIVPIALGTQTRGSLIRPASYCGAFGFKPSLNKITTEGLHPVSKTFDHLGIISGSIEDTWEATKIMSNINKKEFFEKKINNLIPKSLSRVAFIKLNEWHSLEPKVKSKVQKILEYLKSEKCKIITNHDLNLKNVEAQLLDVIDKDSMDILSYEIEWPYKSYPEKLLDKRILELIKRGESISTSRYKNLLIKRKKIIKSTKNLSKYFDVFLSLSSTGIAPNSLSNTGSRHYQVPWSYLGFPSISLPLLSYKSMPIGIQLIGFPGKDHQLLQYALWLNKNLSI
ncbi:amidase [Alphaproteobacteria bacterium]|nr:amidase [Alphaproteobacteria bacterium]